jgi:hypothetical protein
MIRAGALGIIVELIGLVLNAYTEEVFVRFSYFLADVC